jgi:hypothetical protein
MQLVSAQLATFLELHLVLAAEIYSLRKVRIFGYCNIRTSFFFVDIASLENQQQQNVLKFKEFIIAQDIELVFEAERRILSIRA